MEEAGGQGPRPRVVTGGRAKTQPAFTVLFTLLFVLLCILGLLANAFIVLVLSREWVRRGRLLPSDLILFSLGLSASACSGLEWGITSTISCIWSTTAVPGSSSVYPGTSQLRHLLDSGNVLFLPLKLITLSIPGSVFLVSIALLIDSLRRHAWRMQHRAHSLQDPSSQAHTTALKSLVSFLVLYTLSFMSLIIDAAGFCSSESDWYWPWQILIYLCIFIHPFILILGSLRLRGVFGQLILLARSFWVAEVV
ncbi:hypothetical protein FD754_018679 [Muntiacus muntjak]|uniref:Taste receptor type 2 member 41 n=1 Tax=Muntiacus muntjak TaxID=9888 RepID=A0A5N3UY37_MUNMU|nr:hypothetical protein FD754_018679 [Muntiacus muntjak]